MKLRALKPEDAPLMLEWMHDPSVVENLHTDFARKTMDDCLAFIAAAQQRDDNINLAITDDDDIYLGTVSLKHIHDGAAEFAITIRKCAMGKGYSIRAMRSMLEYGIADLRLNSVFWCVSPENMRAVRFYDKNGFRKAAAPDDAQYTAEEKKAYLWYVFDASDMPRKDGEEA